jgi:uncharacterized protein YdeI (YjbR/CyaY-like superfamily)
MPAMKIGQLPSSGMEELDGIEVIAFADGREWESWLAANHERLAGLWLKIAKKASGVESLTELEAVEGGLCWGWISGQRKSYNDVYYLQKYTPRRPGSVWSKVNVDKVEELMAAGRMRAPGLAEVAAAKADGRWAAAYESQRTATVPPDLQAALERSGRAKDAFDALSKTARYLLILPLLKARTPEGRAAQLAKVINRLEDRS